MCRQHMCIFVCFLTVCSLCSCEPIINLSLEDLSPEDIAIEYKTQEVDDKGTAPKTKITVTTNQILPITERNSPQKQGGDCWNDYFFQFSTYNSVILIYNLEEKALIQKYSINNNDRGFVSNCHCNSVCFGSSFFEEGDEFPLLYVSTGYASGGYSGALVYRITKENGKFSFSLVQTIRIPILKSSWTEFITAGDYCYVGYTSDAIYYKMLLPSVHDGDVILDGSKDAIEVLQFPPQPEEIKSSRNQGKMFHNGKIIFPSGVPQAREASVLIILDLKTRTYEHIFDFTEMGLLNEPESVFIWKDTLCVAFIDQIVSFEFTPDIIN